MPEFSNQVLAVTGAGSGIGAEVARQLLRGGGRVIAIDVDQEGLERLAEDAPEMVRIATCDITDESRVAKVFADSVSEFGRLDGLVNAAGIVTTGTFLDYTFDDWDKTFRVNLWGSYVTIKHAVPHLRAAGGGRIVNFSSIGGKLSNPFTAPYAASKAAVISLTRSAASALAPEIRINCVVPGIIDTPMWEQLGRDFESIAAPIDFVARAAQAPLARPGNPDEVAAAVLFLLSDAARFITGEDLNVSGGLVMY
jgi:NAD(P)-dependent dehydrogenase (short-subunit alcohol dehydrogenase family)